MIPIPPSEPNRLFLQGGGETAASVPCPHFLQGKRVLEILPSWEGPPLMSIALCACQTGDPSMGFRVADPDLPAQKVTADIRLDSLHMLLLNVLVLA